jgi:hypothetical protein
MSSIPLGVEVLIANMCCVSAASRFGFFKEELQCFVQRFVVANWEIGTDLSKYLQKHCQFVE